MNVVWLTITEEFSDLPNLEQVTRVCVRLLMALLLAGAIGYERERNAKSAGLRTHMMVGLGSALFVLLPLQAGMLLADMSRVLQGVMTGIGFLGAGTIIKLNDEQRVRGLTTASSIWTTAAIGVAAGMGFQTTAALITILALFILGLLGRVEHHDDDDPK